MTLEALAHRAVPAWVVIGAWPARPELVHRMNLRDLGGEFAGALPEGVGCWPPARFRDAAPDWLAPVLHGRLSVQAFLSSADSQKTGLV